MPTGFSSHLFIYLHSHHLSSTSHYCHASDSPARTTHRGGWKRTCTAPRLLFCGLCARVSFAPEAPDVCSPALENSSRRQKIWAVRWRCQPRRRARCSAAVTLTACCGHSSVMTVRGSRSCCARRRGDPGSLCTARWPNHRNYFQRQPEHAGDEFMHHNGREKAITWI